MSNPVISVIMSVYNEPEEWLVESIESILKQSFSNFEFIIINDNPKREIISTILVAYQKIDLRLVLIENKENIGLTKSLNKGLLLAKGKYIVRMDADDISLPNRFEKQVEFMEKNPNIVASGSSIIKFGSTNEILQLPSNPYLIRSYFVVPNPQFPPIAHPTAIIRGNIVYNNRLSYNEEYETGQDYGLWSEMLKYGDISNLNEVLLKYRVSEGQITKRNRENQKKSVKSIIRGHISDFFRSYDVKYSVPDKLHLSDIYKLKKIKKSLNKSNVNDKIDSFIFCYYMSLDSYGFKVLFYYIFSFDILMPNISIRKKAKVIINALYKSRRGWKYI